MGLCKNAVDAYVKFGDVKRAIDCCVLLNQWNYAVELAEQNNFVQIEQAKRFTHRALPIEPGEARLPVSLTDGQNILTAGPDVLTGWIETFDGERVAEVSAPRRDEGIGIPYWEVRARLDRAVIHTLRLEGDDELSQFAGVSAQVLGISAQDVATKLAAGETHVIRMKIEPGRAIKFTDIIRGPIVFQSDTVDDKHSDRLSRPVAGKREGHDDGPNTQSRQPRSCTRKNKATLGAS